MGDIRNEFSGMAFGPVVQAGSIDSVFVTVFPAPSQEVDGLPRGPAVFVGREQQLDALLADLSPRKAPKTPVHSRSTRAARRQAQRAWAAGHTVLVLSGPAGVGKTALVLRAARETIGRRWYLNGIYADLGDASKASAEPAVFTALGALLHSLGVAAPQVGATTADRMAQYRVTVSTLAKRGKPVLVVLDNVSSLDEVEPLLPPHPRNCAVVVSRHRLTHGALMGVRHHALGLFEPAEAVAFVTRALAAADHDDARAAADPDAVRRLSEACGRLPLALDLAVGELVADRRLPVSALADRLRDASRLVAPDSGAATVRAAFELSYTRLPAAQARLFRLLSLHPGAHFGVEEAASLGALPAAEAAVQLMDLFRVHLLAESGPKYGGYRFQGLLRSYATDLARTEETDSERTAAVERLLDYYVRTVEEAETWRGPAATSAEGGMFTGSRQALRWLDQQRLTLIEAVRTAGALGLHGPAVRLALRLTGYLELRCRTGDRLTVLELAATAAHSAGDHNAEAECRRRLGHVHAQSSPVSSALPYYGNAMTLFLLGGDSDGARAVVGDVLALLERYRAHERDSGTLIIRYEAGLAICRQGGDPAAVAVLLNDLGNFHQRCGAHHRAAGCHAEALALREQARDLAGVAESLANLANAQRGKSDDRNAATGYERAAALFRELRESRQEAQALENLGLVHLQARRIRLARPAFEQAAEVFEREGMQGDAERVRARVEQLRGRSARRRAIGMARHQAAHVLGEEHESRRGSSRGSPQRSSGTGGRRPDRIDIDVPDLDDVIDFTELGTVPDYGLDYGDDGFDDGTDDMSGDDLEFDDD
ncbi:tetratricopeptide repeat protein [Streptomyces sp. ME19-01-6]|uniref:tetratricopeptide repeat protein n=1 Tax=Streptomyces sp. ME19-01-6 TaxID=3028686 RepID=UPI0029A49451|nr:tetratricopeptide repeat protein [Streptomyces sp. ME19-01-6]MDX3229202.1 tetratricopeptide repeat protein [Streptomyces sp. ME19-01-6]